MDATASRVNRLGFKGGSYQIEESKVPDWEIGTEFPTRRYRFILDRDAGTENETFAG
jgi:hypothetical protein